MRSRTPLAQNPGSERLGEDDTAQSETFTKEKRMNPMESTLHNPALISGKTNSKAITIAYWIVTALFCLEMSFTAYYELLVLP
jgi:hypothetical protein